MCFFIGLDVGQANRSTADRTNSRTVSSLNLSIHSFLPQSHRLCSFAHIHPSHLNCRIASRMKSTKLFRRSTTTTSDSDSDQAPSIHPRYIHAAARPNSHLFLFIYKRVVCYRALLLSLSSLVDAQLSHTIGPGPGIPRAAITWLTDTENVFFRRSQFRLGHSWVNIRSVHGCTSWSTPSESTDRIEVDVLRLYLFYFLNPRYIRDIIISNIIIRILSVW